ncbi:MAG TPA: cyclic nucleotide-binding domain-containing protein [Anaeromyxobacteraceae bacterium]|nr:cyclic nucleotide-binding domain-containing protein [Anaeromyxobacteraceae bacterium]
MADLRELKDRAAEHLRKGRFAKAAEALRDVVREAPRDLQSKQKLAEALRRAGEAGEALRTYRDVADRYAASGELIKAIAVCKIILEIDPDHVATQAALADLYGRRRYSPSAPPRTPSQPQVHREPGLKPVTGSGTTGVPLELEMIDGTGSLPLELDRRDRSTAGFTPVPGLPQDEDPFASATSLDAPASATSLAAPAADEPPFPASADADGDAAALAGFIGAESAAAEPPVQVEVERRAHVVGRVRVLGSDVGPAAVGASGTAADEPPTPFEEFVHAARDAADAGIDEGIFIETDELPEGDEPLEAAPPPVEDALPVPVLPEIPLFSDLSRDAFVQLARDLVRREVRAGEQVVRQGEPGRALFVVVSGKLRVEREADGRTVLLARLSEGDFVGEMALLSGEPRMASVVADEPCELLEIRAEALTSLCRAHPHVAESLTRFYRRRLLANAMMTSPVFRPFARNDRANLARRFRSREVATGEVVVREGQKSDGLYIVLSGRYEVRRGAGSSAQLLATLREGDLFGEMSCLRKQPASASVVAGRPGILLRLPRADFDTVAMSHPQMLELVAGLADERTQSLEAAASRPRPGEPGPFLV